MPRFRNPIALAALVLLASLIAIPAVDAQDDETVEDPSSTLLHDEARQALKSGLVLPLDQILAKIRSDFPGDIIEIEFEKDRGQYIYEIEIIRPDGRVIEVKVDAKTIEVLEVEDD
ncbi:PepSY domain-containing protein [Rhizobium alvei]|uniref:PepSY domain-containing protein n=1 Tax=Rhizobium alvei TaxID=1132659 RepID=A0ABT8YKL6_9HYPH|nr:PepSY domain-containing protein [Rhizobium alvei]MDO6964273.1 PepSY domain-containing protein [Rhizobium alvei]